MPLPSARALTLTPDRLPSHGGNRLWRTIPTRAHPIRMPSPATAEPLTSRHLHRPGPKALDDLGRDGVAAMPVKQLAACTAQNVFHSPGPSPPIKEAKHFPHPRRRYLRRREICQRHSPLIFPDQQLGTSPTLCAMYAAHRLARGTKRCLTTSAAFHDPRSHPRVSRSLRLSPQVANPEAHQP